METISNITYYTLNEALLWLYVDTVMGCNYSLNLFSALCGDMGKKGAYGSAVILLGSGSKMPAKSMAALEAVQVIKHT